MRKIVGRRGGVACCRSDKVAKCITNLSNFFLNVQSQGADSQRTEGTVTNRARKIAIYSENDLPNARLMQSEQEFICVVFFSALSKNNNHYPTEVKINRNVGYY